MDEINHSKPIVILTGKGYTRLLIKLEDEGAWIRTDLDSKHPLHKKEEMISNFNIDVHRDGQTVYVINDENIFQYLNNALLVEEGSGVIGYEDVSFTEDDIAVYEVMDGDIKEVEFGEYGYSVEWMNKRLDHMFNETVKIQENKE